MVSQEQPEGFRKIVVRENLHITKRRVRSALGDDVEFWDGKLLREWIGSCGVIHGYTILECDLSKSSRIDGELARLFVYETSSR